MPADAQTPQAKAGLSFETRHTSVKLVALREGGHLSTAIRSKLPVSQNPRLSPKDAARTSPEPLKVQALR